MKIRVALLLSAALLFVSQALADDSSAALSAGGVVLTRAADIRMAKEDLYVSPDKVRIRFEFANDSKKDISTVVAFPLPDIESGPGYQQPLGNMTDDPVNFVGFSVIADGKPVTPQVEQRAIYKGRDVTATLAALHIPVNAITGKNNDVMQHLTPAQVKTLERDGLGDHEMDDGSETPHWTVRTKFYWTQKFPAGKTVVLEHSYQPVTGGTFYVFSDLKDDPRDRDARHWNRKYCIDPASVNAIRARIMGKNPNGDDAADMEARTTDYILMSGNNWKGPIGHFHLTLDKQKPANILSLCWNGALKTSGPATFDYDADNYAPPRDIHLLVLSDIPNNP